MNLILLGGNSVENKQWIQGLSALLNSHFDSMYAHHYRHWELGGQLIDLDYELNVLSETISAERPYVIIAKSAGVLLTVKGITEEILKPKACVCIGTPVQWGRAQAFDVDTWFQGYSLPTLFVQQSYDPAMSFSDLTQYLLQRDSKNYVLSEMPGDDHVYDNVSSLRDVIANFI